MHKNVDALGSLLIEQLRNFIDVPVRTHGRLKFMNKRAIAQCPTDYTTQLNLYPQNSTILTLIPALQVALTCANRSFGTTWVCPV